MGFNSGFNPFKRPAAKAETRSTNEAPARKFFSGKTESEVSIPVVNTEILGEWDHEIIERGLTNVLTKMYSDFGNTLPDTILLPDTSARPLLYALKPTFDAMKKAGVATVPQIYFFRSTRTPMMLSIQEFHAGEIHTDEEYRVLQERDNEEAKQWGADESQEKLEATLKLARPSDMKAERDVMKERAKEIVSFEEKRLGHAARIAVIDDYATEDATTMKELRRAFQNDALPFYTVFAQSDETNAGQIIDPYDDADTNPNMNHSASLSYRRLKAIGVTKTEFEGDLYSNRIEPESPDSNSALAGEKKKLREEMRTIGEKIASNILNK